MEKEKNNNGNTILLTVIGVATLLVALVGATFAYFSATIDNSQAESIQLQTATPVGLSYKGGTLSLDNIVPGDSKSGTFTVLNPATATDGNPNKVQQTYDLTIVVEKNNLVTTWQSNNPSVTKPDNADTLLQDQLRVYISSVSDGNGKNADGQAVTTEMKQISYGSYEATDKNSKKYYNLTSAAANAEIPVVNDQQIGIGETHTYSITVEFAELDIPQDANQGKEFAAHIEIGDTKSVKES